MLRRYASFCQKMVGPVAKREAVARLQAVMGLSERRACGIVGADRKMVRYRSCRPPDSELRGHLRELARPSMIVSDNGTEFTCNAMLDWSEENKIDCRSLLTVTL